VTLNVTQVQTAPIRGPSRIPLVHNLCQILEGYVQALLSGRDALVSEYVTYQLDISRSVQKVCSETMTG